MAKPKISICIPTFNRADLLEQTLKSVAAQTVKPYEVIVVDNHSDDDTDKVCRMYKKKYGFKYVRNPKNLGMIGNWNKAIGLAKGNYICLLHSDDLISPDWHATWIDTIQKHKADFYTSAIVIIDIHNKPKFTAHIFQKDKMLKQPQVMKAFLVQGAPMIAPSGASIYKRRVFREIGLYDESFKTEADVPHFLNLASRYDIFYRDKIVFAWRSHENQTFDTEKVKKSTQAELNRMDNYFHIVSDFYKKHYKSRRDFRLFIQTHAFMTLGAVNLHIVRRKFDKVIGAHKIARKRFPDLYTHLSDWAALLKIQYWFLKRAVSWGRISAKDKAGLAWLKKIN